MVTLFRHNRLPAAGLAIAAVFMLGVAPGALAHARRHHSPALTVTVKPAAADVGSTVTVSGRIRHAPKRFLGKYHVDLQLKEGRRLSLLGSAKPSTGRRFSIAFPAPVTAGTVRLRLRLRQGKRELAHSKLWTLSVRAAAGGAHLPQPGPRTLVLSPGTVLAVPPPGEPGEVRVSGNPGINVGDIIVVGLGPSTPNGFLGRVTSVVVEGGVTVLGTVPATLEEALPEGEFSKDLDGGEIDSAESPGASKPAPSGTGGDAVPTSGGAGESSSSRSPLAQVVKQHVDMALHCGGGAQVRVSGNVAIHPSIDIGAGWSLVSGVHAHFIGRATASTELSASADASASCNAGPVTLFSRTLSPIEFTVGPVPVVVVPEVSAYLSADGKVEASIDSEVHSSVTASAGIEYSHGDAHPVGGFEKTFGWTPPNPSGSAHLGAKVSPTLDLLLYGVGGPEAAFNVGLSADADLSQTPAWTLTAPVSLTAKLAIPVLGISSPTLTVYQHSFLLAQAEEPELQGQIHFDEYPEGTTITNQYANQGVIFDSPVFISQDGANPTSPVLSGTPLFSGPIMGHFVNPGTSVPTTVNLLQLDAGYIDNPGSVEIVANLADGHTRTAVADHLGIDQISIATRGIKSFTVQAVSEEAAGFAIDNLGFGS